MEVPLGEVLRVEYQDFMNKLGDLAKEREGAIRKIHQGPGASGARTFLEKRERLRALRKMVELRLQLRQEYGNSDPRLFAEQQLKALLIDIDKLVNGSLHQDQESLAERGSIVAHARSALDKLALRSQLDQMKKGSDSISINVHNSSGAIINVNTVVGDIHSHVQNLRNSGDEGIAEALDRLTCAVETSADLAEMRGDVLQSLSQITQQALQPSGERQTGVVKILYLGLSAALAHAADVAEVWNVYGPQIAAFFGFTG
jgi:hypothetical protein